MERNAPSLSITLEGTPTRTVALAQSVTTIGRSVDNVLEVPDPNMSRRHCVIERRDTGEAILTDCNSSNGTKVNGERVVSQELRPGDEIECGSTRMRFSREVVENRAAQADTRGPGAPASAAHRRPTGRPLAPTAPMAAADAFPGERPANETTQVGRATLLPPPREAAILAHERDDLRKLLEITKRLNRVHDVRRLIETIIDAAIELMAAERGFLTTLTEDDKIKIDIARAVGGRSVPEAANVVSTQVCRQVIDTGLPVLTTNAQTDERFGRYKSVVGLNLRSILCVPLRIRGGDIKGTVYLDAAHVGAFGKRDEELLEAFADQAALAIHNALMRKNDEERQRMDQELKVASEIQRKLLPRQVPKVVGIEVCGSMDPAKEVGGDYYDFVTQDDGKTLFFCIGDVSGKGVPAGMVMASARSTLRSLVGRVQSTREIVLALNRLLCEDLDQEMFLSFVLMRYDSARGTVEYTGAGHEHILVWRAARREVDVLKTGGMVLGITTRLEEAIKEETLTLAHGDVIVLYTDGATEAVNEANEQFGLDALVESVKRHGHLSPKHAMQSILGEVRRWKGRAPQRDDITLVVARRNDPRMGSAPLEEFVPEEVTRAHFDGRDGTTRGFDWSKETGPA